MSQTELIGVYKKFGDNTVVRDVNLFIENGDFVVLVGPSGCGKSTTLRMVAGLEDTSKGLIKIAGRDVTNDSPRDRDVARHGIADIRPMATGRLGRWEAGVSVG